MTLIDVHEMFSTDAKCRELLKRLRWPNGPECPKCKAKAVPLNTAKNLLYCKDCDYQFTPTAGTIFHDSHLPLIKWFTCVYLLCESRKGMSANQIKRILGVSYKTAWYLCHRIRHAMKIVDAPMLDGKVEAFSLLKLGIVGTWHSIIAKHLQAYLDEMTFRFDRRKRSDLWVDTLRHMVTADPLTFEKLTANPKLKAA